MRTIAVVWKGHWSRAPLTKMKPRHCNADPGLTAVRTELDQSTTSRAVRHWRQGHCMAGGGGGG